MAWRLPSLLLLAAAAVAAEPPGPQAEIPAPPPQAESAPSRLPPQDLPGGLPAAEAAAPAAYLFTWDQYRTLVVVGEGQGRHRPAWVATFAATAEAAAEGGVGRLDAPRDGHPPAAAWPRALVAYRALAYRDARGRTHIDARRSLLAGAQAGSWSPDSFLITPPGRVDTIDDDPEHPGHQGRLELTIPPDGEPYRELRQRAELAVGGGV
jgi:hypothetical protein